MDNNLKEKAEQFFADEKNKSVNKIYLTADGNVFTADHYAQNWATGQTDKSVYPVSRELPGAATRTSDQSGDKLGDQSTEAAAKASAAEARKVAEKRYIELFDKKPTGKKLEQILALNAEKEAELAAEEAAKAAADEKKATPSETTEGRK